MTTEILFKTALKKFSDCLTSEVAEDFLQLLLGFMSVAFFFNPAWAEKWEVFGRSPAPRLAGAVINPGEARALRELFYSRLAQQGKRIIGAGSPSQSSPSPAAGGMPCTASSRGTT